MVEAPERFLVNADLLELSKYDVNVAIRDNLLTIKWERKHEVEKEDSIF